MAAAYFIKYVRSSSFAQASTSLEKLIDFVFVQFPFCELEFNFLKEVSSTLWLLLLGSPHHKIDTRYTQRDAIKTVIIMLTYLTPLELMGWKSSILT